MQELRGILHTAFENSLGLIGFGKTPPRNKDKLTAYTTSNLAPFVGADADDTAKGILALELLGIRISVKELVKEYEGDEYFKTYALEINSSFSTNCNVLMALLNTPRPMEFETQIKKIVRYLCKSWDKRENGLQDKWVHASAPHPQPCD